MAIQGRAAQSFPKEDFQHFVVPVLFRVASANHIPAMALLLQLSSVGNEYFGLERDMSTVQLWSEAITRALMLQPLQPSADVVAANSDDDQRAAPADVEHESCLGR